MEIPDYARYDYCVERSCEFLEAHDISQYPLKPLDIIKLNRWGLVTYSELAKENQCNVKDTITALGTEDGITIFDGYNYTIAYNDTKYKKRALFTLMHEIGHIYLNHLVDFEKTKISRGGLTDGEYKVLEKEADVFARNCLAPAIFVQKLKRKYFTAKTISKQFGVSNEAAKTRLSFLKFDIQSISNIGYQSRFIRLYYAFYYRHGCLTCGAILITRHLKYCSICGETTLIKGEGAMHYEKYEIHEDLNKLKTCLKCGNEDTNIKGDYCQICGGFLINRCDDRFNYTGPVSPCGEFVPSNARYCPRCGNRTTFLNDNILKEWNAETNEIESMLPKDISSLNFMASDTGEELPFI